jgi:predicted esterase
VPDRAPPALPDPSLEVPPDLPPAPPLWRLPATPPPAEGWPVVMLLHGWRSNEQDFAQVASWFAAQGVVAVAVPAIHTEDHPTSRRLAWPQDDSARVHRYLQRLLETSPHRAHLGGPVWLGGFSQGARYALTLTAEHPDRYAGALAISPAGWSAHPTALRAPRPLYLIGGAAEIPRYRQGFLDAKALWERHPDAPLRVVEHSGGHHFPPDTERALTDALRWLRAAQSAP